MVRPSQLLHPSREPVRPRPAATLLLLRDTPQGFEVLMTRRSEKASFAPDAYVFPGGGIDRADAESHALADRRAGQDGQLLTDTIAAIRESFEELGVLLARRPDGRPADAADIAALDRQQPFAPQCAARGLVLAADTVFTFGRWITSPDRPKRFDVPFLVARMPEGQEPVADETEQFEPVWLRPADALARGKEGNFFLMFPTQRTLQRLATFTDVGAVLAACVRPDGSDLPVPTYCPRGGQLRGKEARFVDSDPAYGELVLVCPDGQVDHRLDWQHEHAVPLLKNVMRLTAPNASVMTGPGTNSYLVGDPSTGYLCIDPGPNDTTHLGRLFAAAGGDIRFIVCTHSHADHSPGARPLQALCVREGRTAPPVLGLPSAPTARPDSHFVPDRALANHEHLVLAGLDESHDLEVVFTPGHAANHLCLVLAADGLLFSGDHVLNGSTTIVSLPDGDMGAYLRSLDVLAAACAGQQLDFILPAHGYVLHEAARAIGRLKAHRLAREAKVAAALRALPQGSTEDWVRHAYADTPEALWPIAARSLMAHVAHLREVAA
jgi:recombination protein RecT